MKLNGAIDHFTVQNTQVTVGGWAYCNIEAHQLPVDSVKIEGVHPQALEFFSRGDFQEPNKFGFRIQFTGVENLLALAWGASKCAVERDGIRHTISVWTKCIDDIVAEVLGHKAPQMENSALYDLTSKIVGEIRSRKNTTTTLRPQEILVDTGMTSYDGTATLGKDGYIFLSGGKNSVEKLYEKALSEEVLSGWVSLIRRRGQQCEQLGTEFVQLIIPEKQSILSSYYPETLSAPTPTLQTLTTRLMGCPPYLDTHAYLLEIFQREDLSPFRRIDSHLSFHGAMYLAREICRHLTGIIPAFGQCTLTEQVMRGDLGNKFASGDFLERVLVPSHDDWDFAKIPAILVDSYDPATGHTGTMREWFNEQPLINKSIMVFGNSMFERGESPLGLSWWFSRIFRSTMFFWGGALEAELIERRRPDYVVAQTVERFLTAVPPR